MPQLEPFRGDYYLWNYLPSLPAAVIFCCLFAILSAAHAFRLYRSRLWFCIPFVVGGVLEVIGYAARSAAHSNTASLMPYIIQNLFLLLPPAFFSASIYMVLKRTIVAIKGQEYSIIPIRWLTRIFVLGDVLSFWVQGGGGGLMASSGLASVGEKVVVVGLLIQVVLFGLFCATAFVFHYRYKRLSVSAPLHASIPWEQTLWILYSVSLLIIVRSVFRVVEFAMGQTGYLLKHEWTLYVFDSALMFIVMVVFFIWYPGNLHESAGIYQRPRSDATDATQGTGLVQMNASGNGSYNSQGGQYK